MTFRRGSNRTLGHISMYAGCTVLAMALALGGCKTTPPSPEPTAPAATPPEQQEQLAQDTFLAMLEVTGVKSRAEAVPELEAGYRKIIYEYPKSSLNEQAYFLYLRFLLKDNDPPREDEAEAIYQEYFKAYPDARLTSAMNETLARFYFAFERWEKLARFTTPFMKKFKETGKLRGPMYLYLYSEAKFHLGLVGEAEIGYTLLADRFPGTLEGNVAAKRIEMIEEMRNRAPVLEMPAPMATPPAAANTTGP